MDREALSFIVLGLSLACLVAVVVVLRQVRKSGRQVKIMRATHGWDEFHIGQ